MERGLDNRPRQKGGAGRDCTKELCTPGPCAVPVGVVLRPKSSIHQIEKESETEIPYESEREPSQRLDGRDDGQGSPSPRPSMIDGLKVPRDTGFSLDPYFHNRPCSVSCYSNHTCNARKFSGDEGRTPWVGMNGQCCA